jgi:hypothetical protein
MTVGAAQDGNETRKSNESAHVASVASDEVSREAAIARLRRKRKFVSDFIAYVTVNGVLWLIWLLTDRSTDGSMPWPAWISVIWGLLLVMDAWRATAIGRAACTGQSPRRKSSAR